MLLALAVSHLTFLLAPTSAQTGGPGPKHIVGATYPRVALLAAIQGTVKLEAVLSEDGRVREVSVISGNPLLGQAAKQSLLQWRFFPCTAATSPCKYSVQFVFALEDGLCDIGKCAQRIEIDLPGIVTIRSQHARAIVN